MMKMTHTQDRSEPLFSRIDRKLSSLSDTSGGQIIFKVHQKLRSQNEEAYEPQMFSIGPYHRGKINLQESETHKLRYLKELLGRRGEPSTETYIRALTSLEDQARRCYAEDIGIDGDDFVEMLCLDGCFIIEFFRKLCAAHNKGDRIYRPKSGDPIFQKHWLIGCLIRDIILFENQLPFFILVKLFEMTKLPRIAEGGLIDLAIFIESPLYTFFPSEKEQHQPNFSTIREDGVIHLLQLMHISWCSSFSAKIPAGDLQNSYWSAHIKSARELRHAGVKFKKVEQSASWLDITFENGVVKMPPLHVHDTTECLFRNLIAYELYMLKGPTENTYVLDYVIFMDCLIDTVADVEKLRHCQIISKWLGDDEAISSMFNKLLKEVEFDESKFSYLRVFEQVNECSSRRWNIWRAHLMTKYFNNPWSIISFVAAVLLLLLTSLQTILSILQYVESKKGGN